MQQMKLSVNWTKSLPQNENEGPGKTFFYKSLLMAPNCSGIGRPGNTNTEKTASFCEEKGGLGRTLGFLQDWVMLPHWMYKIYPFTSPWVSLNPEADYIFSPTEQATGLIFHDIGNLNNTAEPNEKLDIKFGATLGSIFFLTQRLKNLVTIRNLLWEK